jgi:hypothetical protein
MYGGSPPHPAVRWGVPNGAYRQRSGRQSDLEGPAQVDPLPTFMATPADGRADQGTVIHASLLVMRTTGSRQFVSSAFASFRSAVSKPSVNQS